MKKNVITTGLVAMLMLTVPFAFILSESKSVSAEREYIENYVKEYGMLDYLDKHGEEKIEKYCTKEYVLEHMGEYLADESESNSIIVIYFDEETQTIKGKFADTLDKGRVGKEKWADDRHAGYYIYIDSVGMSALVYLGPAAAGAAIAAVIAAMFGPGAPIGAAIGSLIGGLVGHIIHEIINDRLDYSNGWVFKVQCYTVRHFLGMTFETPENPDLLGHWPQAP